MHKICNSFSGLQFYVKIVHAVFKILQQLTNNNEHALKIYYHYDEDSSKIALT